MIAGMDDPAAVTVMDAEGHPITPQVILNAYWQRCFPMAETRRGRFNWYRPETRAVITWDAWKVPESLQKVIRNQRPYHITIDSAFARVIALCAERDSTWISLGIEKLYVALHQLGVAHSVEAWNPAGELVGGLYGIALGGCFCGESMFHRAPDASKICVVTLVAHLRARGFRLLDCQQQTPHMQRFGAREIPDSAYAQLLAECAEPRPW
jgi:leucyl/phenylalanyl-tRNA---protein transferase